MRDISSKYKCLHVIRIFFSKACVPYKFPDLMNMDCVISFQDTLLELYVWLGTENFIYLFIYLLHNKGEIERYTWELRSWKDRQG